MRKNSKCSLLSLHFKAGQKMVLCKNSSLEGKKKFSGLPQKGSFLQKAKAVSRKVLMQLRTSFSVPEQTVKIFNQLLQLKLFRIGHCLLLPALSNPTSAAPRLKLSGQKLPLCVHKALSKGCCSIKLGN